MSASQFSRKKIFYAEIALASLLILLLVAVALTEVHAAEGEAATQRAKAGQVEVEIVVMEYTTDDLFDLGISGIYRRLQEGATGPGILSLADLAFASLDASGLGLVSFLNNIRISEGEFELLIQALEQNESIEILSQPRLLLETLGEENRKAFDEAISDPEKPAPTSIVGTVTRVPFETSKVVGNTTVQVVEFKDTGVRLEAALLDIIGDEYVELYLHAAVGAAGPRLRVALAEQPEASVIEVPEFFSRSIRTQVVVRDRQVLVVGALLSTEKAISRRNVPILGNIPLLKYLFSSYRSHERYRELIFFVKPRIRRGGYVPPPPDISERELNAE